MKRNNQFWWLRFSNDNLDWEKDINQQMLFYDHEKKKWVTRKEYTGHFYPSTFPCRSYKAAKRHLRKHNEIPKGTKFVLASKWVGGDRCLVKK